MITFATALLLLAGPIAFGMLRFMTTGRDARYLVVALVSTVVALAMLVRRASPNGPTPMEAVAAAVVAALASGTVAAILGARSAVSIAVVSIGFAICSATGAMLFARSRVAMS